MHNETQLYRKKRNIIGHVNVLLLDALSVPWNGFKVDMLLNALRSRSLSQRTDSSGLKSFFHHSHTHILCICESVLIYWCFVPLDVDEFLQAPHVNNKLRFDCHGLISPLSAHTFSLSSDPPSLHHFSLPLGSSTWRSGPLTATEAVV